MTDDEIVRRLAALEEWAQRVHKWAEGADRTPRGLRCPSCDGFMSSGHICHQRPPAPRPAEIVTDTPGGKKGKK
jgi:hypothetical protein